MENDKSIVKLLKSKIINKFIIAIVNNNKNNVETTIVFFFSYS